MVNFLEGQGHSGCNSIPKTDKNIEEVMKMLFRNPQSTIREIADDDSISVGSGDAIFFNAWDSRSAKFVPNCLQELLYEHCSGALLSNSKGSYQYFKLFETL